MSSSTARLEARITTELHATLKKAAELQGRTVSDFVIAAVQQEVQRVLESVNLLRLSVADSECFAQAFIDNPAPAPALLRAAERHRVNIGD